MCLCLYHELCYFVIFNPCPKLDGTHLGSPGFECKLLRFILHSSHIVRESADKFVISCLLECVCPMEDFSSCYLHCSSLLMLHISASSHTIPKITSVASLASNTITFFYLLLIIGVYVHPRRSSLLGTGGNQKELLENVKLRVV
jgi:hypothetical protein